MARSRAVIRGAGYQPPRPSKRSTARREQQRVEMLASSPPAARRAARVADRVLWWRRKRTKRRQEQVQQLQERAGLVQTYNQRVLHFRRNHRRLWRGIITIKERERLSRYRGSDKAYDHPQLRRVERELRQGRITVDEAERRLGRVTTG